MKQITMLIIKSPQPHGINVNTSICQKSENGEKAEMHEVRRGLTFSDIFFKKNVLGHTSAQMYQSHKTLRLRSEMRLSLRHKSHSVANS